MNNKDLQEIISVIWEDETTVNPNNWIPCDGSSGGGVLPRPPAGTATHAGASGTCTPSCA